MALGVLQGWDSLRVIDCWAWAGSEFLWPGSSGERQHPAWGHLRGSDHTGLLTPCVEGEGGARSMDWSQVSCWCLGWWLEGKDGASLVVPEERALMGAGVGRGSIDLAALRPAWSTPGLILRGFGQSLACGPLRAFCAPCSSDSFPWKWLSLLFHPGSSLPLRRRALFVVALSLVPFSGGENWWGPLCSSRRPHWAFPLSPHQSASEYLLSTYSVPGSMLGAVVGRVEI